MRKYEQAVGLDAGLVWTLWGFVAEEEQHRLDAVERRMKNILLGSKGAVRSKLVFENIDVEAEKRKRKEEFYVVLVK